MAPQPDNSQEGGLLQKMAVFILSSLIVGAIGSGIITWHISESNRVRIEKLEEFAGKGDRCTSQECKRIDESVHRLHQELDSHERKHAHREAAERIRNLERRLLNRDK